MTRLHAMAALALLFLAPLAGARAGDTTSAANAPIFEPAPMPNPDLYAPIQRANEDPKISPTLFEPMRQFRGDGYSFGSTSQGYEQRHMLPAAGANLSVPLK